MRLLWIVADAARLEDVQQTLREQGAPGWTVAPVLEEIAGDHPDKLRVAKVNVDEHPGLAQQFQVMSIPTLILFKDGEEVQRVVGAKGKAQLLEDFSAVL